MEKSKKSKKKLIGIIAGCAMAFVLTVVVSVAVTLAYFGDKGSDSATITMGSALNFVEAAGKKVTASTTLGEDKVLPGASGDITVAGTIAQTDTTAYLRVKVVTTGSGASSIVLDDSKFTCDDGTFVKNGSEDTEYYYLAITDNNTKMQVLNANTTGGKAISFTIPYSVAATLTNDVAGQDITVTVTMEIIQSANIATDSTVTNVAAAWNASGIVVD